MLYTSPLFLLFEATVKAIAKIWTMTEADGKPTRQVLTTYEGEASAIVPTLPLKGDLVSYTQTIGDEALEISVYEVVARMHRPVNGGVRIDVCVKLSSDVSADFGLGN